MPFLIKIQLQSKLYNNSVLNMFAIYFCRELKYKYNVTTIPQVVVVRKDGSLISKSGEKEIEEIGVNVLVTWTD